MDNFFHIYLTDSLKFTSALSVALAVVFVVVTAGIAIVKLFDGSIHMPRLLPDVVDFASFLRLFTVVPVIVTAYVCHYNGKDNFLSECYILKFALTLIELLYVRS